MAEKLDKLCPLLDNCNYEGMRCGRKSNRYWECFHYILVIKAEEEQREFRKIRGFDRFGFYKHQESEP